MKKLITVFAILFLVTTLAYSQAGKNFTIGVNGGLMAPMGDFGDAYKASPFVGLEASYPATPTLDIIGNTVYNILSAKTALNYTNTTYYYIEATAGARLYFTKVGGKFFGEAAVGSYMFGVKYTYNSISYDASTTDIGFNIGIGGGVPLSKDLDFIGKARFHNIFTSGSSTNYFSIGVGINYTFK